MYNLSFSGLKIPAEVEPNPVSKSIDRYSGFFPEFQVYDTDLLYCSCYDNYLCNTLAALTVQY